MTGAAEFSDALRRHFSRVARLTEWQVNRLYCHYGLLVRWNRVVNLTGIRKLEDAVARHYCESLFLGAHLPADAVSVLDVGSGAGFPGIPVAVLRPDCTVTLAESHQRKAVFLQEATRGYGNVRVACRRAAEIGGNFDWVVSRAVRWEDVLPVAESQVALLVGEADASEVLGAEGFAWQPPLRLPWGVRRVLVIGKRST